MASEQRWRSELDADYEWISKKGACSGNRSPTDGLYLVTGGSFFKSTDGGATWNPASSRLPTGRMAICCYFLPNLGSTNPDKLYAF
jgi:hypothetical protein